MKKSVILMTFIGFLFFGTLDTFAADRRGLQLVLLSHWSPQSVDNFLKTFESSPGSRICSKGSFNEIELGIFPYSYNDPNNADNVIPTPSNKYGDAITITDCFINGGKRVYVTVFLSFHAPNNGNDAGISSNAKTFNDSFLRQYYNDSSRPQYYNKATISVSPSLEDNGTNSQFTAWSSSVASRIDSDKIGLVYLQRSPDKTNNNTGIIGNCESGERMNRCFGGKLFFGTKTEYHGEFNQRGDVYSNDGEFVYYPISTNGRMEKEDSLISSNPYTPYTLADFINRTNSAENPTDPDKSVLLWRPAYNLLRRYVEGNQIFFTRNGRSFSDTQTSINSTELNVLTQFFEVKDCGYMSSNTELKKGRSISSCNGDVTLIFQTDGNVVLYNNRTGQALWHTATGGRTDATKFIMQSDGNLVLYASNTPLRDAGINSPNAYLAIQDDHNLVIYSSSGVALWHTATTNGISLCPAWGCRIPQ